MSVCDSGESDKNPNEFREKSYQNRQSPQLKNITKQQAANESQRKIRMDFVWISYPDELPE